MERLKMTNRAKKIAPSVRKMFAEATRGEHALRVDILPLVDGRILEVDTATVDGAGRIQVLTTDGRCMQIFPREVAG
jgi:hypothetical protein